MVYVTGDTHGDPERLSKSALKCLNEGDTLIVCGDFGYIFDGSKTETQVINFFSTRKFITAFVDGTHDNLTKINRARTTVWKGGKVHRIKGNLLHLMRGQIFNIDGTKFFAFGGGESIDKDMRIEQNLWWREEEPTPDELAEGAEQLDEAGLKVDYIVTHEPPSLVKSAMLMRRGDSDRVNKLNGYFDKISRECEFKHWYFGSLHEDRTITERHTCVFKKVLLVKLNEKPQSFSELPGESDEITVETTDEKETVSAK